MKISEITFVCILTLPLFGVARAQSVETLADVRCLMVGSQMSKSLDKSQQYFGTLTIMYYLGRLEMIVQRSDLEGLIAREASKVNAAELKTEAIRCGKTLVEEGQMLQRIGNNLVLRDQQQSGKKSAPPQ